MRTALDSAALAALAAEYFKQHPSVNRFHATADGMFFPDANEHSAHQHAKQHSLAVTVFRRTEDSFEVESSDAVTVIKIDFQEVLDKAVDKVAAKLEQRAATKTAAPKAAAAPNKATGSAKKPAPKATPKAPKTVAPAATETDSTTPSA